MMVSKYMPKNAQYCICKVARKVDPYLQQKELLPMPYTSCYQQLLPMPCNLPPAKRAATYAVQQQDSWLVWVTLPGRNLTLPTALGCVTGDKIGNLGAAREWPVATNACMYVIGGDLLSGLQAQVHVHDVRQSKQTQRTHPDSGLVAANLGTGMPVIGSTSCREIGGEWALVEVNRQTPSNIGRTKANVDYKQGLQSQVYSPPLVLSVPGLCTACGSA
eukprot:500092-Pelagomonas_calceolata.AAC.12